MASINNISNPQRRNLMHPKQPQPESSLGSIPAPAARRIFGTLKVKHQVPKENCAIGSCPQQATYLFNDYKQFDLYAYVDIRLFCAQVPDSEGLLPPSPPSDSGAPRIDPCSDSSSGRCRLNLNPALRSTSLGPAKKCAQRLPFA
ncbi:hypothetical protein AVEN_216852-1 [Araneus ventricosus]|uniref:Uncharacterized protein n=1 Tax=Araneus ventricosus TaxID=182803 RepID=A0A4Y2THV6_ARAVE|nr:hypothetical protein AVEN_216852-1 [Araneus ventricosus]